MLFPEVHTYRGIVTAHLSGPDVRGVHKVHGLSYHIPVQSPTPLLREKNTP